MQVIKPILVKNTILRSSKVFFAALLLGFLPGCVTQNFSEDKPVVDRDFSDEQIAKTRISLALGYLKIGNTSQAKQNLEKAKQYAPRSVAVYSAFAHYYESVGEYEQTENAYLTALDIDENDANTLNNFGVFLCRQSRVEEAESYFLKAIKVPTYIRVSESYENIALCYLKENDFGKAEHAIERSIAHSPNSASSLFQMAQLQYAKGQYRASLKYLERFELATRRFSSHAVALAYKVNQKLGNDDVAQNYATMLLNMFPQSTQAKAYIDNGLAQIEADNLAFQYRKYKLLKSGIKVNKKPLVVARKKISKNDGFKQKQPEILVAQEKLVDDETIIKQTSQSIANNSHIAQNGKNLVTTVVNTPVANSVTTTSIAVKKTPVASQVPAVNVAVAPSSAVPKNNTAVVNKKSDLIDTVHVVQEGENLYQISLKYNIMISTLRRWNNLKKETIKVGQVLRLTKPE